jgi:LCP family protein required for cell wall assembly
MQDFKFKNSGNRSTAIPVPPKSEYAKFRAKGKTLQSSQQGGVSNHAVEAVKKTNKTSLPKYNSDDNQEKAYPFSDQSHRNNHYSSDDQPRKKFPQISPNQAAKTLQPKKVRKLGKIITLSLILISTLFLGTFGVFAYNTISAGNKVLNEGNGSILGTLGEITETSYSKEDLEQTNGRTNFLILGINPDEDLLTDTIIMASYYHLVDELVITSIPRDTAVTYYNYLGSLETYKINALYSYSERRSSGSGPSAVIEVLSDEFKLVFHYWVSINFQGVVDGIDQLGGVEIDVSVPFTDCQFPNDNYQVIDGSVFMRPCPSFEKGRQTMDGRTALIYARSRHGYTPEGINVDVATDFDRSRRQSEVIEAGLLKSKEKIESGEMFLNPGNLNSYLNIFSGNVKTSLGAKDLLALYSVFQDLDETEKKYHTFSINTNEELIFCDDQLENGQYILTYCDGSVIGGEYASEYRSLLANRLQNILEEAKSQENSTLQNETQIVR